MNELKVINKIMNLWDPYGVIGLCPMDEYGDLSLKLFNIFKETSDEAFRHELYKILKLYDNLNTLNDTKMNELIDLLILIHENFSRKV